MASYDILGNIAILKFPEGTKKSEKIAKAKEILNEKKSVKTILEKQDRIKGRLRTFKTKYILGEKSLIANYTENGCKFKFNVETCYFSPRLSNERKEIAQQIKKNEKVLVLFAGVAPFSIVIGKLAKPEVVYSVEINREASKYAAENVKLNKLENVKIIQGDVKKVIPKLLKDKLKFNRIVMPRPNLKETFLKEAFKTIKKNGIINYYGFGKEQNLLINQIKKEAKSSKKKIKILRIKKAGEIAPYKYRFRVDFKVLS